MATESQRTQRKTQKKTGEKAELENHAFQAVLEETDVKVEEQTDMCFAQPQVGEKLRFVEGIEFIHGFQFDDEPVRK